MALDPYSLLSPTDAAAADAAAAEAAHEGVWAEFPEQTQKWGARGKAIARTDMGFHVVFLRASLDVDAALFSEYAGWAASVLEARGVESEVFARALEVLAENLPEGREACLAAVEQVRGGPTRPETASENALAAALMHADVSGALALLPKQVDLASAEAAAAALREAMFWIGEAWSQARISVADEHIATATCQAVLGVLRDISQARRPQSRALLACVEGNLHDLGLRVLADNCAKLGTEVRFLGADVPTDALVQSAVKWQPDLVFLSAALAPHLLTTRHAIERLRAVLDVPIFVGGNAFPDHLELWRLVGADGQGAFASQVIAHD